MISKSKIKYIQSLYQKKNQEAEQCFIAEGPKMVNELLQEHPGWIRGVFYLPGLLSEKNLAAIAGHAEATEVTEAEMSRLSAQHTPAGALAIVQMPVWPALSAQNMGWTLALDGIQDPGNLGTLIRIADWFGLKQVVCSPSSAYLYNPKVIQSTMGSFARIPVYYTNLVNYCQDAGWNRVYAAVLDGRDVRTLEKKEAGILLIGNESKGIGEELLAANPQKISIPAKGGAESLNAAVAAGILLSHLV